MSQIRLICIANAGGSSALFYPLKPFLDPSIQLVAVELPGRGRRFNENLLETIHDQVRDIFRQIKESITKNRYALFGYSMGALLAYELYQMLADKGYPEPEHLFLSSKSHPQIRENEKILHTMDEEEFIQEVIQYGGKMAEISKDKMFRDLFVPVLRADFKSLETYQFNESNRPIGCDVTVLYGKEDWMHQKELIRWTEYVNGQCRFVAFDGGHFFIHDRQSEIGKLMNCVLC